MTESEEEIVIELEGASMTEDVRMQYQVETGSELSDVFDQYAAFRAIPRNNLEFCFKGVAVKPNHSPASLGMKEDDNRIQVKLTGDSLVDATVADACASGQIQTVMDLIVKNDGLHLRRIKWTDVDGQELCTPLVFIAIDFGHNDLVKELLPLHKDIINTLQDEAGDYTALQWASFAGNLGIIKTLVEDGGAIPDEEALSLAREYDHPDVADYLFNKIDMYSNLENDDEIMEKACREGDNKRVKELLGQGYDVSKFKDEEGKWLAFSPMFLALKNGHLEVIQIFAEMGISLDTSDEEALPKAVTE
ncbi:hypothetical protein THAOC_00889 [Thalassiosira oceanica]|uniref:Rad60/SUMO-like domain-containing protein n=1 Tax=Thalassiosira oceanica TaxID=159749 RepID=K0TEZ2_THAOC|nr:hypothetical protein THAOC_00889 [Thalassiosira oceanica]|mmetsp:Transcript_34143/g.81699  ORF Transcript_34143/g.81699 Transcript_34143/m.81699 type:complete len:305 (+) Transcript_34143:270-1184(+)|eukprot:EJK77288.1 hypothetical protein THAOC_00889 [Thalassiosira oceanica]